MVVSNFSNVSALEDAITVTANSQFNGAMFYIPAISHLKLIGDSIRPPAPNPGPGSGPGQTVVVKVCMVDASVLGMRCPANEASPDGGFCSCNLQPGMPPVAGRIQSVGIPRVLPFPGGPAQAGALPIPAPR